MFRVGWCHCSTSIRRSYGEKEMLHKFKGIHLSGRLIILVSIVLLTGCLRYSPNLWEKTEPSKAAGSDSRTEAKTAGSQTGKSRPDQPQETKDAITPSAEAASAVKPRTGEESSTSRDLMRSLPEDERVKLAAIDIAKSLGGIERMKVCHVKEDDEWWAILYQDAGSIIDLKQFIWNRKTQKFDPFLVIRNISRDKLEVEIKKKEPGRVCTPVEISSKKSEGDKP